MHDMFPLFWLIFLFFENCSLLIRQQMIFHMQHINWIENTPTDQKENQSAPVIAKFVTRYVKNFLYYNKTKLKDQGIKGLGFTESLTKKRLAILEAAKEKFGYRTFGTSEGNIFAYMNNQRKYIRSLCDIEKLSN